MILTIAYREFKTMFLSPMAWTVLSVLQLIMGLMFVKQVDAFLSLQPKLAEINNAPGLTDVVVPPLFGNAGIILLLVTPLLTMRLISEERRNKTLSLLLSAPVSDRDIILGKFSAVLGLLLTIVGLLSLMPLTLYYGGVLDTGKYLANILALSLLIAAFAAAGLYMSCITEHPTVAAIGTFGLLLLLWIIDWSSDLYDQTDELIGYLSILKHFQNIQTGLIDSADVIYFLLFSATFIILSISRLNNDRLQK